MSLTSKENVINYLYRIVSRFNVSHFNEIAPKYFDMPYSELRENIEKRKLYLTKKNLTELLILHIKKAGWKNNDIISVAFNLELEYVIKFSKRYEWTANMFLGSSSEDIPDLADSIKATIRKDQKDAIVLVEKADDFFWISIIIKNLKKLGIFEKPRYIALSAEGKYFFTRDNRCGSVIKYVTSALGYEKEKKKRLSGKSLASLMKLLQRRENADMKNRPVFESGEAARTEFGLDFTQKENFYDFFDKCVDNETDIDLQRYTITSVNCPWMGDNSPALRNMAFKSTITLNGNVARIIKQLPVASIVRPPFPNYLKNFSVAGRNVVGLKSSVSSSQNEVNFNSLGGGWSTND